jgi:hypothetical protein
MPVNGLPLSPAQCFEIVFNSGFLPRAFGDLGEAKPPGAQKQNVSWARACTFPVSLTSGKR